MTTATTTATWPTEATYEAAGEALAAAYNHVEKILWDLSIILDPYNDEGRAPSELPTAETIGLMWSFLDGLKTEADQLQENVQSLEQALGQADAMRRDMGLRGA